jgi:Protein of unknown function (DUF2800)
MNNPLRGEWTSASNALADRLCRGRHQAQRNLSELPGTDQSETGNAIHALWTGTAPEREPTAEEIDKAEALREQETRATEEFFGTNEGIVRIVERRLWHEFPAFNEDPGRGTLKTSGQFDVALIQPKAHRALICDGKSGWLPVSPNPANLQLRRLAALLWLELNLSEIGVCILKPFERNEPICLYAPADLKRSVLELQEDVRHSHEANARRTAGEEQCRYCRARESCPTRLAWLSAALPAVSPPLPMLSARDWTPAQRVRFLECEKDARDWLEARKNEIKVLLAEIPDAVPGYTLKTGRTVENIIHPQEVLKRFCNGLGGTMDAFMKCLKVGKTALADEVRALRGHKGKALEADLEALLAGCVEFKTSAPTIERLK